MRLVIPSWLIGTSSVHFEIMNPLLECVARVRELGSRVPIEIPFLQGFQHLRPSLLQELRSYDVNIFDASDITRDVRARLPRFQRIYERWGTIQDLCFVRHFVMRKMGRTPFIFMDNDIILNATPEELGDAYAGQTFIVRGSPCFGLVSDPDWLEVLCKYTCLLHDDPVAYARAVGYAGNVADLSDPAKARGSDQMLTLHLAKANILPMQNPACFSKSGPFILSSSWLRFDLVGTGLRYKRINNRDTVDGKVVAISHIHKDFLNYLGTHNFVTELGHFQGFGRMPPPPHLATGDLAPSGVMSLAEKLSFARSLEMLHDYGRSQSSEPLPLHRDPYSRRNAIKRYHQDGDFSEVFNDRSWWKPAVWK